jgi:hypothetical protein
MDLRTVVRTTGLDNLRHDLTMLAKYPALATLHPGLGKRLEDIFQKLRKQQRGAKSSGPSEFYAVPYSVAYGDELMKAYALLNEAAEAVRKDDEEFGLPSQSRARFVIG